MNLYKDGSITDKFTVNYKLECERRDDIIELNLYNENIHKWVRRHVISVQKLMNKTILSKLTKDEPLNLQELINSVLREKR